MRYKKVEILVRVLNFGSESNSFKLQAKDNNAEKYIINSGYTRRTKTVAFSKIFKEFVNDDIVKITFQKVGVSK